MKRGLLIAAAAVVTLVPASSARAAIVLDRSIAGVAPGMTRAEAEKSLGDPVVGWFRSSSGYRPDLGRAGVLRYRDGVVLVWETRGIRECEQPPRGQQRTKAGWAGYVRCALAAIPDAAVVQSVVVTTGDERTAGGLGVGSTFDELKRALPSSALCLGAAKTAACTTRGRALQTRFVVFRGRVTAVELRSP